VQVRADTPVFEAGSAFREAIESWSTVRPSVVMFDI